MAAAVELAAERDKLATLKQKKQALEQQLAAAAARDADACAAAARAMRAAVAATPLESDPAADTRRDLREKRATLREQQALLAAWTCVARANAAGDVEALAAVQNEAGPVAAAAARALAACERLWAAELERAMAGVGWPRGVAAGDAERAPLDRKCVRRLATACRRLERLDELHGRGDACRAARVLAAPIEGRFAAFFLQEHDDADDDDGPRRRDKPEWACAWLLRVWRAAQAPLKGAPARVAAKLGEAVGACARAKLLEALPVVHVAVLADACAALDEEVASSRSALAVLAATRARRDAWRAADADGAAEACRRVLQRCDAGEAGADALAVLDDAARGPSLVQAEVVGVLNRLEARYARLDPVARKELWSAARGAVVREVLAWAAPRWDEVRDIGMVGWSRRRGEAAPTAWRAAGGACALVYAAAEARGCERVLERVQEEEGERSLIGGGVVLQAALRVAKRTKGVAARAQLAEDLKLDPAALGADAAAALTRRAENYLKRVADLAAAAFRRASRRSDALGDAWLAGFLAEARDALPRAALRALRAPLAKSVVEDALKRRPQKLLAARVADLAAAAFRRASRRSDALGDAWLAGFLAEARDALPRAALRALRAPLAKSVVEDALKRRPQKLLAARVAAARRAFAGVDDAAAAALAGLEALSALDRPRRTTLHEAFRGLVDTARHDSLEVAVTVADETVRRQLHGMLEANGVRGLDDVAAARFLEACTS